ncbi:hypothetical protein BDN72DRAFT_330075 [Pluteus cervinus]|uniref:Uncharacterized protein n=1 Tax=Pluteus cervinus TaxID=181527 RepID=A0ACD3ACZ4_9AGAR|nr:hypothetical protein BDN72DRAFT_330075 [Pluteus cervinus]
MLVGRFWMLHCGHQVFFFAFELLLLWSFFRKAIRPMSSKHVGWLIRRGGSSFGLRVLVVIELSFCQLYCAVEEECI